MHNIHNHIYSIFIFFSLFLGILYIFLYLKKKNVRNSDILIYMLIFLYLTIIGGKIMSLLLSNDNNLNVINAGLSSYGGMIGVLFCSLIYEKINYHDGEFIKGSILSLPLIYSIAKLGCFFSGCCYGIPYNGIFKVIYPDVLNEYLFPIQVVESIVFFIIFVIINYLLFKKKDISIEFVIILCAFSKFSLDFLRYDHVTKIITINQIISLILIILALVLLYVKKILKIDLKKILFGGKI